MRPWLVFLVGFIAGVMTWRWIIAQEPPPAVPVKYTLYGGMPDGHWQ